MISRQNDKTMAYLKSKRSPSKYFFQNLSLSSFPNHIDLEQIFFFQILLSFSVSRYVFGESKQRVFESKGECQYKSEGNTQVSPSNECGQSCR